MVKHHITLGGEYVMDGVPCISLFSISHVASYVAAVDT